MSPLRYAQHWIPRASAVSVLLGIALALLVSALSVVCKGRWRADRFLAGDLDHAVIGAAFVSIAVGVRLPQRFTLWLGASAWKRFIRKGKPSTMSAVLVQPAEADRALHWIALSIVALIAGVLTATTPFFLRVLAGTYDGLLAHFVWSDGPLALLQACMVLAAGLPPLLLLGIAVSFMHRLCCPHGRWEGKASAWILLGIGTGMLGISCLGDRNTHGNVLLFMAALPALTLSLIAAAAGTPRKNAAYSDTAADSARPPLPVFEDCWPTLLRASIVAVGGGAAALLCGWVRATGASGEPGDVLIGVMVLSVGAGALLGARNRRTGPPSIGDFGVVCAVAGVMAAGPAMVLIGSQSVTVRSVTPLSCVGLAAIGYATATGRCCLLGRVGSRSFSGAAMMTRLLLCAGITYWVAAPIAVRLLGRPATIALVSLSLLTVGGSLIIHEPEYSSRSRGWRLCGVFGAIGLMITVARTAPAWHRRTSVAPEAGAQPSTKPQGTIESAGVSARRVGPGAILQDESYAGGAETVE